MESVYEVLSVTDFPPQISPYLFSIRPNLEIFLSQPPVLYIYIYIYIYIYYFLLLSLCLCHALKRERGLECNPF